MIVQKSEIAPKLAKLKTILSKSPDASTEGVLFKDNCLTATNFEICITSNLDINTDESFIIPARAIDLIENLPEGQIEIIPDEDNIRIKAKGINNVFQSVNPNTFPRTINESENECGTINCTDFAKAVNSVIYAVSDKSIKPMLTGIYFESKNGKLNLVGCDGYRMAWTRMDYENEFSFIVPKMHLKNVLSLCKAGEVKISCSKLNAVFKTEEFTIYTRLLEGTYIVYENMFTKRGNITAINRHVLLESLKRALINVEDRNKALLKFNIKNKTMTIMAESSLSQFMEEIELERAIDEPLDIGFNGVYLMDCLKALDSEVIEFNFGTEVQPLIIEESDKSSMVLPIRM
jgi:DNA polymerase III beta subunit